MKILMGTLTAVALFLGAGTVNAQELIDKGFVSGWNVMMDPSFGNGCLIQTVYENLSVVRIGYDATEDRGYFAVFNDAFDQIEDGKTYDIRFELDGKSYPAEATGFYLNKVPGVGVFFKDRAFIRSIAQSAGMTVYGPAGRAVMAIDLAGSAKALDYARKCQDGQL